MSWFSFLRKNKLEPKPDDTEFYSHAEDILAPSRGRRKSSEEPVDPVLPEKKRARRRLVGALAITLALAILLPMVLDAEPKPVSEDIVIQIPSRDKQAKLSASRPSASVAADVAAEKAPGAPTPAIPGAKEETKPQAVEPTAKPEAGKPPAPAKPEAAKDTKTDAKPAKIDAKAAKADVKAAKPEAKPDAKNGNGKAVADAAQGKFVIQVAALASQEKVDELQAKLSKAGFKAHTQKVVTKDGDRIRVRVGPYADKAEAETACPKLTKMNLKCTVLAN